MGFIAAHLPSRAALIEVGCGAGHVAVELQNRGYQILGVDSDEEAITQARGRGVPVVQASWTAFASAPVDAVVFTRSLHHIHPLQEAVGKAGELLKPTGTLLVEDFAFDGVDTVTIGWFLKVLGSRTARRLIAPVPDEFVTKLLAAGNPVTEWDQSHDHELHTIAAMTQAIAERFSIKEAQSVPYLYRYLVPVLPETPEAAVFVEKIFREETRLGERGELTLIGRRIVASPREDDGT